MHNCRFYAQSLDDRWLGSFWQLSCVIIYFVGNKIAQGVWTAMMERTGHVGFAVHAGSAAIASLAVDRVASKLGKLLEIIKEYNVAMQVA